MNKKTITILLCCALFISVLIFTNNSIPNSSIAKESDNNHSTGYKEIDNFKRKLDEVQFPSEVIQKLKSKGYQSIETIGYSLYDQKEKNELIIPFSSEEYKGEQK